MGAAASPAAAPAITALGGVPAVAALGGVPAAAAARAPAR
jgi:hypothetical protein